METKAINTTIKYVVREFDDQGLWTGKVVMHIGTEIVGHKPVVNNDGIKSYVVGTNNKIRIKYTNLSAQVRDVIGANLGIVLNTYLGQFKDADAKATFARLADALCDLLQGAEVEIEPEFIEGDSNDDSSHDVFAYNIKSIKLQRMIVYKMLSFYFNGVPFNDLLSMANVLLNIDLSKY